MLNCATQQYSVSICKVKERHLLKPEACFTAVMEEVVTASLQLIFGNKEEGNDRWVNFYIWPKGKQNTVWIVWSQAVLTFIWRDEIKVHLSTWTFRCALGVYFHLMHWSVWDTEKDVNNLPWQWTFLEIKTKCKK